MRNRRGSVLVFSLLMMVFVLTLGASLMAVAAARSTAVARESRRAQGLALAESAVVQAQAGLSAGRTQPVAGSLATGDYDATVVTQGDGRVRIVAVGRPRPLVGKQLEVKIETVLVKAGNAWRVEDWREVTP
jgi:Tfp pilus assembly protein PilX